MHVEPFKRALIYYSAIVDIHVDETPAELKVHGQTLPSWILAKQNSVQEINLGSNADPKLL